MLAEPEATPTNVTTPRPAVRSDGCTLGVGDGRKGGILQIISGGKLLEIGTHTSFSPQIFDLDTFDGK